MTYLFKYTLTAQFSILNYTRQLHNTNLLNMNKVQLSNDNHSQMLHVPKKMRKIWTKKSMNDKTRYV